ncbi:MAG: adenylosuccinate synthase [bacterium]|nr:adenylosuccinate synthase [bacterium]
MSVMTIVGAQWGDEGKGKIVDLLAGRMDVVARWGGGPNAGHTVVVDEEKYILHHIPSGILNPTALCLLGAGVVVDPEKFLSEVDGLEQRGIRVDNRLFVDGRAHVILPYHRRLDECQERTSAIGTTGRGIGPAYTDKATRNGIRMSDMLYPKHLQERVRSETEQRNLLLEKLYNESPLDIDYIVKSTQLLAERMKPYIIDVSLLLEKQIAGDKKILFEGAQGTLLDINFGTYPFVTSSEPIAGGASTGLGVGPRHLQKVLGIAKAYVTRVGNGPFPTELKDEMGIELRKRGAEFGSTTGRARRCGWWDNVLARYSARVNGITSWAITKLDVLSGINQIPICTGYETPNGVIDYFPMDLFTLERCKPVYENLPGWKEDISHVTNFSRLPIEARRYVERIERLTGVPVEYISVGEKREQTIKLV